MLVLERVSKTIATTAVRVKVGSFHGNCKRGYRYVMCEGRFAKYAMVNQMLSIL